MRGKVSKAIRKMAYSMTKGIDYSAYNPIKSKQPVTMANCTRKVIKKLKSTYRESKNQTIGLLI